MTDARIANQIFGLLETAESSTKTCLRGFGSRRALHAGISIVAMAAAGFGAASQAQAQAAPTPNLVSACSGVSLPRSVVTDILSPVVTGIVTPVQNTVNPILGVVGGVIPLVPPLGIDAAGLLADAAAGQPINLRVLNVNGTVVGPTDQCDSQADSFTLANPKGISIGGNRITGLGTTGLEASAGELNSVAFGNSATTATTANRAIAIGPDAAVLAGANGSVALGSGASVGAANSVALGAGSTATRGALAGYTAIGLTGPQNSAGEVSIGAPGAPRQLTNVAAGTAATDAANVGQVAGVSAAVDALANTAVQYDTTTRDRVTLAGAGGTTIGNLAPGALTDTSTEAVNGSQLYATNQNVSNNTTLVTNLTNNINNGAVGPVRYSNPGTPTVPNGGIPTNDVALAGAAAGPVGLHNVADGTIAAGSTDAVNGGQVSTLQDQVTALGANAVLYDTVTRDRITLGGVGGTTIVNLRPGLLSDTSTEAVNGSQLYATNQNVANNTTLITNLTTNVNNGGVGPVRYSNAGTPTVPNGGVPTNDVTLTGAAAGPVGLHNVAAGTIAAGSTDAVNGGQVAALQDQIATVGANAVQYDTTARDRVTLGGANGTTLTNVAAGTISATSTDAVNGAQLNATNVNVANNTTAITNLTGAVNTISTSVTNLGDQVANGAIGPVQYSNPDTPTTPNGGVRTNDLTLVGAAPGAVALHNVGNGSISAGSTDAVNGGQIYGLTTTVANAVTYTTNAQGNRTNTVNLVGGNAAAPVTVSNVAAGAVTATSNDAVNGSQLYATNQNVAAVTTTANTALTLGQNSVQYDETRTNITLNSGGAATTIHNVAAGTSPTDAVNVAQLNNGINTAINAANQYTDSRISSLNFDLRNTRRDAAAGTAGALAAAGLPQAYEAGKGMIAVSMGVYQSETAVAVGFSKAFNDGHTVVKMGGTWDSRSRAGASTGIGYQF